jgi:TonB family protein
MEDDGNRIVLSGDEPVRNSTCNVVGSRPVKSIFLLATPQPSNTQTASLKDRDNSTDSAPARQNGTSVSEAWRQSVLEHIRRIAINSDLIRSGTSSAVSIEFKVDRSGKVLAARVMHSSGDPQIDQKALKLVELADPFPPFDDTMSSEPRTINLPIRFSGARGSHHCSNTCERAAVFRYCPASSLDPAHSKQSIAHCLDRALPSQFLQKK